MHEQATLREDLKALAEEAKKEAFVKKGEFTKVSKAAFDVEVLQKKLEELGEVAGAIDELKRY
jgi:nicotinamidase-related amidase